MNKHLILIVIFVAFFVSLAPVSSAQPRLSRTARVAPKPTPTPSAQIKSVLLDRNEVTIPCPPDFPRPPGMENSPCFNDNGLIEVKTLVDNPKNKPLTFRYAVSGGRIVGEGAKVVWDLNRTRPGIYTISAAIDEGRGFGIASPAQQIELGEFCCCLMPCVCPTLDVSGGGRISAGEIMTFTTSLAGGSGSDFIYTWTVSQGEIVAGQGTPEIKVKTTAETRGRITATVEIGGALCPSCPTLTGSETGEVIK